MRSATIIALTLLLTCCSTSSTPTLSAAEQLAKDVATIDSYLTSKGITAQQDPSGLRYVFTTTGTGVKPSLSSSITVKYVGKLLSTGAIFDQSTSFTSGLSQLIRGWQIGLQLMPKGSVATLYIPSGLGYGPSGAGSAIPPNANLIFDITLTDVK